MTHEYHAARSGEACVCGLSRTHAQHRIDSTGHTHAGQYVGDTHCFLCGATIPAWRPVPDPDGRPETVAGDSPTNRDRCQDCWQDAHPDQYAPVMSRFDVCGACGSTALVTRDWAAQ